MKRLNTKVFICFFLPGNVKSILQIFLVIGILLNNGSRIKKPDPKDVKCANSSINKY
jgi:hypothetical protein